MQIAPRSVTLVVITLLVLTSPTLAQAVDCNDDGSNILSGANCGADSDATGWTLSSGDSLVHQPGDGDPEAGSVEAAIATTDTIRVITPCAASSADTEYGFGARFKAVAGSGITCNAQLGSWSGPDCTGSLLAYDGIVLQPIDGSWTVISGTRTTQPTAVSSNLRLHCQGSTTKTIRIDNAFIGENLTVPVSLQGFSVE